MVPNPSYEPYQCCPTKVKQGTRIAKATPSTATKTHTPSKLTNPTNKPLNPTTNKDKSSYSFKEKPGNPSSKFSGKGSTGAKPEKSKKGRKGLDESGNYVWWW